MSDAEVVQLSPGTLVQDRYLIVRPVGQGGLSTVYQVSDTQSAGPHVYALKEQLDLSQAARKQFAREAGWMKALDHSNIPKVTAFFEWRRRLYLVMEFIAGENLEQKLERTGGRPLLESQVLPWVLPICDALTYMHSRTPPILHRDVKPANIIVTPTGRPVLVDLGIAKEHGPVAHKTATFVRKAGTEGYAPPEQYAAAGLSGPWSDVYGLGATVYHLLTAQIPPTAVERVALDANLQPPSAFNPSVSLATDVAIMRALAIRPQDRYPTVAHFKQALQGSATAGALTPSRRPQTGTASGTLSGSLPSSLPSLEGARVVPPALPRTGMPVAGAPLPSGAMQVPREPSGPLVAHAGAGTVRPATGTRAAPTTRPAPDLAGEDADGRQAEGGKAVFWWAALAASALLVVAVVAVALHLYAPLDRSTPQGTVTGYFAAVQQQDYGRAWQYTADSANDPNSQVTFTQNQRADDALSGHVLTYRVVGSAVDNGSHETIVVVVTRAGAPQTAIQETVLLTQYGGNWLIDSITSA